MIIGLNYASVVGAIERIDLIDGAVFHENVPVMILRTATSEEWIYDRVGCDMSVEQARDLLARRMSQFPDAVFYEVSVD